MRRLGAFRYVWRRFEGAARFRALYWTIFRGWECEVCQCCGRPVREVWWCHDDLLWEKVTGKPTPFGSRESAGGVFCISCFDAAARKVCPWIEWAPLNLCHLQSDEEQSASVEARQRLTAQPDPQEGSR